MKPTDAKIASIYNTEYQIPHRCKGKLSNDKIRKVLSIYMYTCVAKHGTKKVSMHMKASKSHLERNQNIQSFFKSETN